MLPAVSYYLARLKVDDEACAVIGLRLVQNMMRLRNMIRLHISHIPMVCPNKNSLFLHLLSTKAVLGLAEYNYEGLTYAKNLMVPLQRNLPVNCQLFLFLDMSEVIAFY